MKVEAVGNVKAQTLLASTLKRVRRGKVHINGLEGFWAYAKQRLIKHHGVSKERFPSTGRRWNSATITATRISFPWWSNNSPNWCQNLYNSQV